MARRAGAAELDGYIRLARARRSPQLRATSHLPSHPHPRSSSQYYVFVTLRTQQCPHQACFRTAEEVAGRSANHERESGGLGELEHGYEPVAGMLAMLCLLSSRLLTSVFRLKSRRTMANPRPNISTSLKKSVWVLCIRNPNVTKRRRPGPSSFHPFLPILRLLATR